MEGLGRIDEYRHTPRIIFGVGAVNEVGKLAEEIAKNENCIIITGKALREQ